MKLIISKQFQTFIEGVGFSLEYVLERAGIPNILWKEELELSPMEYKRFCGLNYKSGFQVNPKAKWTAVAVGRILRNEFYLGIMVQGRRTTPNHKVKKTVLKPSEEWIRVEDSHPAIIEREDFLAVEKLLLQDTRIAPKEEKVYLLSGLVFCGDCGQGMVRNSVSRNGKTYVYYMCGNNRTNKTCTSHRISAEKLEGIAFSLLKQHIAGVLDMERTLAYIDTLPLQQEKAKRADRQLLQKQEEAERYSSLKKSLYESMMDGLIDKTEYLELKAVYDEKLREASEAEKKIRAELEDMMRNRTGNTAWIERFKNYRNITELTRQAAVSLIDRILIFEDSRIEVVFKYQDYFERVKGFVGSLGVDETAQGTEAVEAVGNVAGLGDPAAIRKIAEIKNADLNKCGNVVGMAEIAADRLIGKGAV